jgi:hypothetical protein
MCKYSISRFFTGGFYFLHISLYEKSYFFIFIYESFDSWSVSYTLKSIEIYYGNSEKEKVRNKSGLAHRYLSICQLHAELLDIRKLPINNFIHFFFNALK